jgi:hypothetical protein
MKSIPQDIKSFGMLSIGNAGPHEARMKPLKADYAHASNRQASAANQVVVRTEERELLAQANWNAAPTTAHKAQGGGAVSRPLACSVTTGHCAMLGHP